MNMKINILPNEYLLDDGRFDMKRALNTCGKIAGVCYSKKGYNYLVNEEEEKTNRRIDMTLNNGHHSVYDHIFVSLNIENIPKILAMYLNNEKEYTTSEKSARYTPIEKNENSIITNLEEQLYNKWVEIFKVKIKSVYSTEFNDNKILKLAQENARYLVTVFMPTKMVYTTSLRQLNYMASWMFDFINNHDKSNEFEEKLSNAMQEFWLNILSLDLLEQGLMFNEKKRTFSLVNNNIDKKEEYFGDIYSTNYKASFAYLAQAQRHRTINYEMKLNNEFSCFIPPIIKDDEALTKEWVTDMYKVKNYYPQGELITINENGRYEDFILKCKERLCSAAQLEIANKTKEILTKYKEELERKNYYLKDDIENYTHGARCTFKDFTCSEDCKFCEGKRLTRKI